MQSQRNERVRDIDAIFILKSLGKFELNRFNFGKNKFYRSRSNVMYCVCWDEI